MTKQECIEVMSRNIKEALDSSCRMISANSCNDCEFLKYRKPGTDCQAMCIAEALYMEDYRKVPDGAVVLTKEDLNLYAKDCIVGEITGLEIINALIERAKRKAAEARKVAVKEFAEKMKEICVKKRQFIDLDDNGEEEYYFDGAVTIDEIDKLLKEYEK